jgi:AcrR family transcriptional regulator
MLREWGLAGLSMRRLAEHLGVQPGALYYHVESKQDLLAAVAERILADHAEEISNADPRQAARAIREALLPVRDSADVVSFVQAFRPDALVPFQRLDRLFADRLPARQARWAAQTLVHYVLGFVAEEQNRAELVRGMVLAEQPDRDDPLDAFELGIDAIVAGLAAMAARRHPPRRNSPPPPATPE